MAWVFTLLNLHHSLRAVASTVNVGLQKAYATPVRIDLLVLFRVIIDFLICILMLAIFLYEKLILFALIDGRSIHSLHCGIVNQRQACFLNAIGTMCRLGPLVIEILLVELVIFGVDNHIMNISPDRLILVCIAYLYVLIVLLVVIVTPALLSFVDPVGAHHHFDGLHAIWHWFFRYHNNLGTF